MNKLVSRIIILSLICISCNNTQFNLDYDKIENNKIVVNYSKTNKDTTSVNVVLLDSTIRDEYYYENNVLSNYIYFDNSNVSNPAKFKIEFKNNEIRKTSGKSIYVVSSSFNKDKLINIGDTVELLIRASVPLFLKNNLTVVKNNKVVIEDYTYNAT